MLLPPSSQPVCRSSAMHGAGATAPKILHCGLKNIESFKARFKALNFLACCPGRGYMLDIYVQLKLRPEPGE